MRVVAATNRDLRRHVNSGQFRADLYYRLAVDPDRACRRCASASRTCRCSSARLLATIAEDRALEAHIEPDAQLLETLARHSWPGNVRELRNYLEQLVIMRMAPALGAELEAADAKRRGSRLHLGWERARLRARSRRFTRSRSFRFASRRPSSSSTSSATT